MATRADVARLAGVPPSSVSYVISNKRKVSQETRQKVLAAIKELNYHPNYMAGALSTGQSKMIAVSSATNSINDLQIYSEYLNGIIEAASKQDFLTLIVPHQLTFESGRFETLLDSGIMAGFIVLCEPKLNSLGSKLKLRDYPHVSVEHSPKRKSFNGITVDYEGAALSAIEILKSHGHKKVALIYSDEISNTFLSKVKKLKINISLFQIENYLLAGRNIAETFIEENIDSTAVICLSSQAGFGFREHWDFIFGNLTTETLSYISVGSSEEVPSRSMTQINRMSFDFKAIGSQAFEKLVSSLREPDEGPDNTLWRATYFEGSTVSNPRAGPLSNYHHIEGNYPS